MKFTASATFVAIVILLTTVPAFAGEPGCLVTMHQLKRMSLCELDRLFEQSSPGATPHGYGRGQVLLMTDYHFPKLRARMTSCVWKGKHFEDCGEFINQWPGFKALRGHGELGVSWHDDKPCLVLAYPPGTPIFGNTRDELREVAPGLYLARLYETCPCPRFRGYFAVETCQTCK